MLADPESLGMSKRGSGGEHHVKSKINVISRTEFETQRGEEEREGEGSNEDDLQFDLDVPDRGDRPTDVTMETTDPALSSPVLVEAKTDLSPIREKCEDNISTTSHPWLEQRARFYPAPILPSKPNKIGKVSTTVYSTMSTCTTV